MGFTSWRGTVGVIKPTRRPGSLEELIRLLPEGIGVVPLLLNAREGTAAEFRRTLGEVEEKVTELADAEVDLIFQQGGGVMLRGFGGEREMVGEWERKHGVPVVTSGMVQVEAMRALGIRRVVSVSRSAEGSEINEAVRSYLADAGFEVLGVHGMDVPFSELGDLPGQAFYARAKEVILRHEEVEGLHILGGGWRVLGVLETLEQDLNVPIVQVVAAGVWAIQQRLHVRQPSAGYGRLLAEMPRAVTW